MFIHTALVQYRMQRFKKNGNRSYTLSSILKEEGADDCFNPPFEFFPVLPLGQLTYSSSTTVDTLVSTKKVQNKSA